MQTEADSHPKTEQSIANIAAYKFVTLIDDNSSVSAEEQLEQLRQPLREFCRQHELKGTILLAPEGINLFIAGKSEDVEGLLSYLRQDERLADLQAKYSYTDYQPFERMLVKIKQEIIAFGVEGVDPRGYTSKKIKPEELKQWLDEGREVLLLDTRNDYEVEVGTFDDALPIGVNHFRDFPEAVRQLPEETKDKPIVMFCTGGIRCEKAGPFMEQAGFKEVYQLDGGILKYFEECGGAHYDGECFVFDRRVAVDPELKETDTTQCYACLSPLSVEDQQSPHYDPPHTCPHCYQSPEERNRLRREQRLKRLADVTNPLPGSVPYDNPRPLNVPGKFDQTTLFDFLMGQHGHMGEHYWREAIEQGRIIKRGKPVPADRVLRAGNQLTHMQVATTEPNVNADIEILHEDDGIVVVNKPAPLPIHPSGRFNRNTLEWILREVFAPAKLRPAHRLDANTPGVVVFCRTRQISQRVQPQFENGTVEKVYLARVNGHVEWEDFTCDAPISREATECGGRTVPASEEEGLSATTRFHKLEEFSDGTTLLQVIPETGRTNQIRVHLWHMGLPIVGDPLYLPNQQLGEVQTRSDAEPMCLHAHQLTLDHPNGERMTFTATAPAWVHPQ